MTEPQRITSPIGPPDPVTLEPLTWQTIPDPGLRCVFCRQPAEHRLIDDDICLCACRACGMAYRAMVLVGATGAEALRTLRELHEETR